MRDKRQRFEDGQFYFACPICRNPLFKSDNTLKCLKNHNFDLSKFGYVNLLGGRKVDDHYSKKSFENRQLVLESGYYKHILEALAEFLQGYPHIGSVIDIGCGEGYYSRELSKSFSKDFLAFDISKDSIQLAAKSDYSRLVKWFVSDLARLPIQDQSVDCILDIFSPANYEEFKRVLKKDGYLLKLIPTENHLREIREKVGSQLEKKAYSNTKVVSHFQDHFEIIGQREVRATYPCSAAERAAFIEMTPLLFNVDSSLFDWTDITHITVSALLLIGRQKES